jgi:hypothetical protein
VVVGCNPMCKACGPTVQSPTDHAHMLMLLLLLLLVSTHCCFSYNAKIGCRYGHPPSPCYVELKPKVCLNLSVTLCIQTDDIPEASFSNSGGGGLKTGKLMKMYRSIFSRSQFSCYIHERETERERTRCIGVILVSLSFCVCLCDAV